MSSLGRIRIAHRRRIPGEATTGASGNSDDGATIADGAGKMEAVGISRVEVVGDDDHDATLILHLVLQIQKVVNSLMDQPLMMNEYQAQVPWQRGQGIEMDFRSFMIQGINGEFNFLPEGGFDDNQGSFSMKSVNNKTPIINTEPISAMLPKNVVDNIIDSSNTSSDDELPSVHPPTSSFLKVGEKLKAMGKRKLAADALREGSHHRAQRALVQESKVAGDALTPLDVDSDPDIHGKFEPAYRVVAHVTPPSWKQHLRDISIEQLCDIHDRAYIQREVKRDKAYADLENKCIEAFQDLYKNPLVSDIHSKIKTLQGQEIDGLRQDRAVVVSKVVPDAIMKLVHSDEMGILVARLVRAAIIHGRCTEFEEVAKLKEPFVLEKMPSYRTSSKDEYDQAREDMANASYPFLSEFTSNSYASVEQLLSIKPRSL
ncbi:hypothetical protein Tco_1578524 [Tanacetum coccineum]